MRICFIADTASIHTQRWVRWFANKYDVMVIATNTADGLPEFTVAVLPPVSAPGTRLVRSAVLARRVVDKHRPDLVHSHFINEAGWFGAATFRRPLVITAWGSDLYRAPRESRLARLLNPWALRQADWVTCDSEDQATLIRAWGVDHVSVIGWGVDRRSFHPGVDGGPVRHSLGIPPNVPVLLSPRQWIPNSNIPAIVAAHARLSGDVYLILKRAAAPEPDGGSDVERALAASSARDRVRVIGAVGADDLPSLYAAADAVVSLCTTDGTPVSVLEAMALGRPIIALDHPSLAEWVAEPGGKLVHSLDPAEVAGAAESFLFDPGARERAAAHNADVVARRADRDSEFARMANIYEELIRSTGNHRR